MSDTTKIGGGLKLGRLTSAPTSEEGLIYYDDTAKVFKFRDDSGFVEFAEAPAGGGYLELAGGTMTGTLILGAAMSAGGFRLTNLADGSAAQDAVTKSQLDAVAAGLDPKASCRVATTANLAGYSAGDITGLGASLAIDGVSLSANDRVLVKDQTDAKQNGIYTYDGVDELNRADDHDGTPSNEVSGGNYTFIEAGTAHAGQGFTLLGDGNLTLDTDDLDFTLFSSAGAYTAGTGITLSAGEFSLTDETFTTAEQTKLGHISVSQAVDLDTMESDIAANTSKVSNASHTGEITGSTALTLDKSAISNRTAVTAAGTDYVLIGDTSDSDNLKKALVADFLAGTGDFLADGSVPMTGNLQMGGNDITGVDDIIGGASFLIGGSAGINIQPALGNNTTIGANGSTRLTVSGTGLTSTVPLAMSTQKITGIADGTAASQDACSVAQMETYVGANGGGDVVDDTSPQLGGSLDTNGFGILSADNAAADTHSEDISFKSGANTGTATDADTDSKSGTVTIGSGNATNGNSGDVVISTGTSGNEVGAIRLQAGNGPEMLVGAEGTTELFLGMSDNLDAASIFNVEGSISSDSSADGGQFQAAGGAVEAESDGTVQALNLTSGAVTIKSGFVELNEDIALHGSSTVQLNTGALNLKTDDASKFGGATGANSGNINITTGSADGDGNRGEVFVLSGGLQVGDGTNPKIAILTESGVSGIELEAANPSQIMFVSGSHGDGSDNGGQAFYIGGDVESSANSDDYTGGDVTLRSGGDPDADSSAGTVNSGDVYIITPDAAKFASSTEAGADSGTINITTGASAGDGERGSVRINSDGLQRGSDGSNYVTEVYEDAINLPNSATTHIDLFDFDDTEARGGAIDYTMIEASTGEVRTGTIRIAQNGTIASVTDINVETASLGVTWTAAIVANVVELSATVAGANNITMRADIKVFRF